MFKYRLSRELKYKMDRELRQYWHNKNKLEILKSKSNSSTRAILLCEERIMYIENVINRLKPFEKQMFEPIFKHNCDWLYCEKKYNISKSTYYNIYNKCIYFLAEEWGEI